MYGPNMYPQQPSYNQYSQYNTYNPQQQLNQAYQSQRAVNAQYLSAPQYGGYNTGNLGNVLGGVGQFDLASAYNGGGPTLAGVPLGALGLSPQVLQAGFGNGTGQFDMVAAGLAAGGPNSLAADLFNQANQASGYAPQGSYAPPSQYGAYGQQPSQYAPYGAPPQNNNNQMIQLMMGLMLKLVDVILNKSSDSDYDAEVDETDYDTAVDDSSTTDEVDETSDTDDVEDVEETDEDYEVDETDETDCSCDTDDVEETDEDYEVDETDDEEYEEDDEDYSSGLSGNLMSKIFSFLQLFLGQSGFDGPGRGHGVGRKNQGFDLSKLFDALSSLNVDAEDEADVEAA